MISTKRLGALAATAGLALGLAAPAQAACPDEPIKKAFAAWGDQRDYKLAPGGDFEWGLPFLGAFVPSTPEGWELSGGAHLVASQHPWAPGHAYSMELPPGASVTTSSICVTKDMPVARMFLQTPAGQPLSPAHDGASLKADVMYVDPARQHGADEVSTGRFGDSPVWAPTRLFSLHKGRFEVKADGSTAVRLRFEAGRAAVRIDDIWIDPRQYR